MDFGRDRKSNLAGGCEERVPGVGAGGGEGKNIRRSVRKVVGKSTKDGH